MNNNKDIWHHLNKEVSKTNTLIKAAQKILKSPLFTSTRYKIFTTSVLDSYTRVIALSIYHLFDKRFSWCLYSLFDLTRDEKDKIRILKSQANNYITFRHTEIGHLSTKVKLEEFRRLKWLPNSELDKVDIFIKNVSQFLNSYGMKRFNEGYVHEYGEVGINLQCLIEDIEKLKS